MMELKNKESDDSDLPKAKRTCTQPAKQLVDVNNNNVFIKNSLQLIREIKTVTLIDYQLVSTDGPPHMPLFKYCLSFKLLEKNLKFYGEGKNKKFAKTLATMTALYYIINLSEFINSMNSQVIRFCLRKEMESLQINEPFDEFFGSRLKTKELNANLLVENLNIVNKNDEAVNQKRNEMCVASSTSSSENSSCIIMNDESIDMNDRADYEMCQKTNESESCFKTDERTREVLSTKNPIIILNHLLSNAINFEIYEEGEMANMKLFKAKLKINKFLLNLLDCKIKIQNEEAISSILERNGKNKLILIEHNEKEFIFYGFGKNKKIAKTKASQIALETLFDIKFNLPENDLVKANKTIDECNFKEFADSVSEIVKKKYNELLKQLETNNSSLTNPKSEDQLNNSVEDLTISSSMNKLRSVYAAVVKSDEAYDINSCEVICVTSGTKCVSGEHMSLTGKSINDCHAEILAIRILRKYLYKNLKILIESSKNNDVSCNSIFEMVNDNDKLPFKLKDNVKFHLFISSAPCGDSRIFSTNDNFEESSVDNHPNRKIRGLLRAKIESGEGTIPINTECKLQAWDSILAGERLKVMSCSDKLCKYNVIGVQGALLSNFISTVYFDSFIVGTYYHKTHLIRAVGERINQNLDKLPNGFKLNRPILSPITNIPPRSLSKSSNSAILWSKYLKDELEVITCKLGKKFKGGSSGVCKYELFQDWLDILRSIQVLQKTCQITQENKYLKKIFSLNKLEFAYFEMKLLAEDYQDAKLKVYNSFKISNLGEWITKPFEQDHFIINFLN